MIINEALALSIQWIASSINEALFDNGTCVMPWLEDIVTSIGGFVVVYIFSIVYSKRRIT